MSRSAGDWLVESPARVAPLADLLCFAGAGAGAAPFRNWAARLPPYVCVLACRLPGREARMGEPFAGSLADAADRIVRAYLARRSGAGRLVLFGHSMGAVLAYEAARRLACAARDADAVIIAASTPPGGAGCAPVDADELRALMLGYDEANARITGNPELFEALGPVIAADIALLRRHSIGPEALDTPAHILSGAEDTIVPGAAAARWARHLSGPIERRTMPGGHFFPFREAESEVLALLGGHLGARVA